MCTGEGGTCWMAARKAWKECVNCEWEHPFIGVHAGSSQCGPCFYDPASMHTATRLTTWRPCSNPECVKQINGMTVMRDAALQGDGGAGGQHGGPPPPPAMPHAGQAGNEGPPPPPPRGNGMAPQPMQAADEGQPPPPCGAVMAFVPGQAGCGIPPPSPLGGNQTELERLTNRVATLEETVRLLTLRIDAWGVEEC